MSEIFEHGTTFFWNDMCNYVGALARWLLFKGRTQTKFKEYLNVESFRKRNLLVGNCILIGAMLVSAIISYIKYG